MSNYTVTIKNSAKKDLRKLKAANLLKNFIEITEVLKNDPYQPTNNFEKLRPYQDGRYSRRINYQHRCIYRVNEEIKTVEISSAWSHYEKE